MSKLKKSLIAMTIISVLVLVIMLAYSMYAWRNGMAYQIDSTTTYVFNDIDLTNPIDYQLITDTYIVGASLMLLGAVTAMFINTGLWALYGIILATVYIVKRTQSPHYSKKDLIDVADVYLERINELEEKLGIPKSKSAQDLPEETIEKSRELTHKLNSSKKSKKKKKKDTKAE